MGKMTKKKVANPKKCITCGVNIVPLDGDFCCDDCRKKYCKKKKVEELLWE